jgi:Kef-type K+ transport system membrane component KefB
MSSSSLQVGAGRQRSRIAYVLLVGVPALVAMVFLAVAARSRPGHLLTAPPPTTSLDRVLLAIVVVVVLAQLAGWLASRLRQPRVVGQMVLGVMLGPSVFGAIAPAAHTWLLPRDSTAWLNPLAQLGVVFFMFLVGRELAGIDVAHRRRGIMVIGHAMIAIPFALGVGLAILWMGRLRPTGVGSAPFALFVGVAVSVTALPVLAHILTERGMVNTQLGWLGICSAAVGDVTAWCLFALTLTVARQGPVTAALTTLAGAVAVVAVFWWGIRPYLHRWAARTAAAATPHSIGPVVLLAAVVGAGLITDWIGLHAIFGAFLAGLICPSAPIVQAAVARIEGVVDWLLLPLFFVSVGLQTMLGSLASGKGLLLVLAVVAVAVVGKTLGAAGAARSLRMTWRDSLSLAAMMNCRGLTELVVLGIGLSAGILDQRLFSAFVVMAILTTAMTGPVLSIISGRRTASGGTDYDAAQRGVRAAAS